MAHIIVTIDQYKYHFTVNLAQDGRAFALKGFKNPTKALAYMGQLQGMGHTGPDEPIGSKLIELAQLWRDNSR